MMLKYRLAFIVIIISLLSGCTGIAITQEDRNSLLEVSVDKAVLPDSASYFGPEISVGAALGGALGGLVAAQVASKPEQIVQKANQIDLAQIVSSEFKSQLEARSDFSGKIKEHAKTHFKLEVKVYGLGQDGPFSSTYKPVLQIDAKLIDANGKVIWDQADYVSALHEDSLSYPYDSYFQSSDIFRAVFSKASQTIARSLLERF